MNIIQTEYSFKEVFYTLEQAVQDSIDAGHHEICLLDRTTFGFVKFERLCGRTIMPIFGLRIHMTDKIIKGKGKWESFEKCEEIFLIAKNQKGISDLLKIYSLSTKQKYYFNRIYPIDILEMDFIVISDLFPSDYKKDEICIPFAKYSKPEDVNTYQCISTSRGYSAKEEHFLTDLELLKYFTRKQIKAKNDLANKVEAAFITISEMIEYNGKKKFDLECWKGLDHLGLSDKEEYVARLEYEIEMIRSKKFQDYFMIVAEMILDAKKNMLVGAGRGSSGGSLVCYCLGITNIDPIKFGLIFERFIDTNRYDLPDIDSDYPDNKRQMVIENIAKRYKSVYPLGVVSRYKPRTILNEFAKAYQLPVYELSAVKDVIVTRNSGDERANNCLEDTLAETFEGQNLINDHPYMASGIPAENHARHSGKHAAGIIVTDNDITDFAAIDHVSGTLCIEGYDAESIGLLKIDCLGLRTLSVIENCLRLSEIHIDDIYNINLEDPEVLAVFATDDLADIFQFDGDTVNRINKQIEVTCFNDLATITALGRPGALDSGGTKRFIDIEEGEETITSYGEVYDRITADTKGIVIFQEQAMFLLREYGNLPWGDVNDLRKIMGKSKGSSAFLKYKEVFLEGAIKNGTLKEEAEIVWETVSSMGCLSGDTIIVNPFPNQNQPQKTITIRDLYKSGGYSSEKRRFYCEVTRVNKPDKQCVKQSIYMVEKDGFIRPNKLIEVYKSGIKKTFCVIAKKEDGELIEIRTTKNHKFMIPGGTFKKLSDLFVGDYVCSMGGKRKPNIFKGTGSGAHNKKHGNNIESWEKMSKRLLKSASLCEICNNKKAIEIHHINGDHYDNTLGNHKAVCRKCHKGAHKILSGGHNPPHAKGRNQEYAKIIKIGEPRTEMTYDISMPEPYNFVANDFVVHNSYAFNKAHSVAYSMISYWCAYCKVKYPLNFLAANLNNAKDDKHGLKMLRQYVTKYQIEYVAVDPEISEVGWTIQDGKLIGGFTNIDGIGEKKAEAIIKKRTNNIPHTKAIAKKLENPVTPYDILYPITQICKKYYSMVDVTLISEIEPAEDIGIVGRILEIEMKDRNAPAAVAKRHGKKVKEDRFFISMIVEDDTGSIRAMIPPFYMDDINGQRIMEEERIKKGDLVSIVGIVRKDWPSISIQQVTKLELK